MAMSVNTWTYLAQMNENTHAHAANPMLLQSFYELPPNTIPHWWDDFEPDSSNLHHHSLDTYTTKKSSYLVCWWNYEMIYVKRSSRALHLDDSTSQQFIQDTAL